MEPIHVNFPRSRADHVQRMANRKSAGPVISERTYPTSFSPLRISACLQGSRLTLSGVFLFVVVIAFCFFSFCIDRSFAAQKSPGVRVVKVHDGDTVTLMMNGKMRKSRLTGIDAPEMNQRPWGRKAKEHLIDIMNHTEWTVAVETDEVTHDKYGRSLVYLWTNDNDLINEQMVLDGYAVLFSIKPNVRYGDRFSRAEKRARKEMKGIWGPKGLKEAPVKYREKHPRKQYEDIRKSHDLPKRS